MYKFVTKCSSKRTIGLVVISRLRFLKWPRWQFAKFSRYIWIDDNGFDVLEGSVYTRTQYTVRFSTDDFSTWLWYLYSVRHTNNFPTLTHFPHFFILYFFFFSFLYSPLHRSLFSSSFSLVSPLCPYLPQYSNSSSANSLLSENRSS